MAKPEDLDWHHAMVDVLQLVVELAPLASSSLECTNSKQHFQEY